MTSPSISDRSLRQLGLRRVTMDDLTIRRRRCGRGFSFTDAAGERVADEDTLGRIRALVIPPAYADVRIAADPRGHIQAVGRDEAGRLQYRYHPAWDRLREARKTARLSALCDSLPRIRRIGLRDLRRDGFHRRRVSAAVTMLIERTHIRIGNDSYVESNRSHGASSLLKSHVRLDGDALFLRFRGKGGSHVEARVRSAPIARTVADLMALRGRRLFRYHDHRGRVVDLTASHVNDYLNLVSGTPVTAKDFRTLAGTALAAEMLARVTPAETEHGRKRQLAAVFRAVADRLGNTPAVARSSYVNAEIVEAFETGDLADIAADLPETGGLAYRHALVRTVLSRAAGGLADA